MFEKHFQLNDTTLPIVQQIGKNMPGGFFIYKADQPEELLYVNDEVIKIFGCKNLDEFKKLTGFTFRGMVHPKDYSAISASIQEQIRANSDKLDYIEYRIIRKDGSVHWVDDYGHRIETETYGGIYYVFISDITDKRERLASDLAARQAVIEALSESYHTVWVINDVETESFSLYRGDLRGDTVHALPINDALKHMKYSQAKDSYISKTVAPEDRAKLRREMGLKNIVKRLNTRSQFNITYQRLMKDGSKRYFRIEYAKVNMPNGKMGVVCGIKDVDDDVRESNKLQEALRKAEQTRAVNRRLVEEVQSAAKLADLMGSVASLMSNMPAMSFSKEAETGKYLACNQSFAEYAHKASPEEVIGLTDYELFDYETARHFEEDDQKALSMNKPYIFFEDVPDASGTEIRNLQTTKLKFTDGSGRLCTLGMCVDVTDMTRYKAAEAKRHELEQQLKLQQQLLEEEKIRDRQDKMITALASDYRSVYHVNLDTNEATCYRADPEDADQYKEGATFPYYEQFVSYANHCVIESYRQGFLDFIEPDNIRKALATEPIIAYRYLVKRNNKEYYEMIRMAGVRHAEDRDDNTVHAVGLGLTVIDAEMRESMTRNNALKEALAAAEEANKAKTAFLSNMSHEIRTPMNAIIGLDELALRDESLPQQTREYLTQIGESARHLLGLINDILDMSRIESGKIIMRREEFSFRGMLEQINTMVMSQCSEKGLSYKCKVIGGVSDYYIGDDIRLKQILINILSNAIKFTEAPGSVTLTVERTAVYANQSALKFSIKDTGIGMDKEFIPKVFETFSQEDATRNNKYGSTGLGMAITKNIVELMNGTIKVESEKGVGTEFTVVITLKNVEHQESMADSINPNDMLVLVVDDEEVAAEHARIVLDEVGIKADTCHNGKEALHMLSVQHTKHEPYNLVLLDWKMPGMDGVELARKIREKYKKEATIIILTAFNWDEIMETALHAGVDSFLTKPLFASNVIHEFERIALKNRMDVLKKKQRAELKGRRLLLAEDVWINAEIVKEVLHMRGCVIEHAENGKIAVEMVANHLPHYYDAVLMDVRMPEMDGLEATAKIRALDRPDAKTIPIIAMTANAFDEDVQRSLQVGMNAHLTKPINTERLYATLEELIWEAEQENN